MPPIGQAADKGGMQGVSFRQQRRSLSAHTHTHTHTHAREHAHTHAVSLSVSAAECPVSEARVMAQYAPQGYALSDELEYLQAYEDVLEKYKGRSRAEGICAETLVWIRLVLTVESKCQPAPSSLSLFLSLW